MSHFVRIAIRTMFDILIGCFAAWFILIFQNALTISMYRFDPFFLLLFLMIFFLPLRRSVVIIATIIVLWAQFRPIHLMAALGVLAACYSVYHLLRFRAVSDQTLRAFIVLLALTTIVFNIAIMLLRSPFPSAQQILADSGVMTLANVIIGTVLYLLAHIFVKKWDRTFLTHRDRL